MIVGYTAGAFDLFHIGHLNHIRGARGLCDRLIVGVSMDELVRRTKGKPCVVRYRDRVEIVRACRYVDVVVPQDDLDKYAAWQNLRFDVLFAGDDWYGNERWLTYERRLAEHNVRVVYLPYTAEVSSTQLQQKLARAEE